MQFMQLGFVKYLSHSCTKRQNKRRGNGGPYTWHSRTAYLPYHNASCYYCGIVALVKISKSRGQLKGNGFAIAGIAIPFAALPIVAMMLAILMPALAKTRQVAYRLMCSTNMSSIGKAMTIYVNDYNNLPTPSKWCDLLVEKADVSPMQFKCKSAHNDGRCNYAMNNNVEKLGNKAPPDMVLIFESQPGWNQNGGPELLSLDNHCGDGCNILFVDGHVEFVMKKDIAKLKWTADPNK